MVLSLTLNVAMMHGLGTTHLYYVPFDVETFLPVTRNLLLQKSKVEKATSKDIMAIKKELERVMRPQEGLKLNEKRIRLCIKYGEKTIWSDADGRVEFGKNTFIIEKLEWDKFDKFIRRKINYSFIPPKKKS